MMDLQERLSSLPGSYDDFVRFTMECMDRDVMIRNSVMSRLLDVPDSDANDITQVLCDCLGIGEPLELVDDEYEDESQYVNTAARAAY
ncbi:MAG: hypothetical protein IJS24_05395 [Eubacterium sp.]|nr:hypothetical protein [Eubacterium sp.]